ncbi:hypothetical protein IMSAGC017_02324 [Thomasclavelia cocleata]|uniref:Uncharacterized protein n=1 Tax=Thomasclavelia cocleata TaxID=69824 RepID=A0A829ZE82_9FIRM|nr:hypothetical protein IMSAGC017_02324 [Thomasclavelia cocleata]
MEQRTNLAGLGKTGIWKPFFSGNYHINVYGYSDKSDVFYQNRRTGISVCGFSYCRDDCADSVPVYTGQASHPGLQCNYDTGNCNFMVFSA